MDTVTSNNNQSIHVYLRVSTKDQEFDSQIESIHKVIPNLELKQRLDNQLDIQQDNKVNVYQEKASGAKKYNRLELTRLLSNLKAGDIVIVNDISRLSRSTIDLLTVVEEIRSKGAILRSVQDAWLNSQDM
ncbi:MAG: recombinase family protein, partial [Niameybacter sp.]